MKVASKLRLLGYDTNASHGFALPLYGRHERDNILCIAECNPSGDHQGLITGFEIYETDTQNWLTDPRIDQVSVGDPWLDVFIWNGRALVGNALDLWNQLVPIRTELEAAAPLSLLEAAMNAQVADRDALAPIAYRYMKERFDLRRADQWRLKILGREASVLIRRHLAEVPISMIGCSTSQTDDGLVELLLPPSILERLRKDDLLDQISRNLSRLADALGSRFRTGEVPAGEPNKETNPTVRDDVGEKAEDRPEARILVLAFGTRSRTIARHIGSSPWLPADFEGNPALGTKDLSESKLRQIVSGDPRIAMSKLSGSYEVVAVLLDDHYFTDRDAAKEIRAVLDHPALSQSIRLLVPALPEKYPSIAFKGESLDIVRGWNFDELLDTSQARSPFWWGNARRSLDRRIADIVSTVTYLYLANPDRDRLPRGFADFREVLVFAVDLASDRGPHLGPEVLLASEVASSRSAGEPKRAIEVVSRDGKSRRRAMIEHRSAGGFDEFAFRVLNDIGDGTKYAASATVSEAPEALLQTLRYPALAVPFRLSGGGIPIQLLMTAEAPAVVTLEEASDRRWHVVRYTDRESIEELLNSRAISAPAEISIGPVASIKRNGGMATRGIDTRDILRLNFSEFEECRDTLPSHEQHLFQAEMRPIRTGPVPSGSEQTVVAIRRKWLEGRFPDDRTVVALANVLRVEPRKLLTQRPYKRAADLDAAWSEPSEGIMRFALADGEVPVLWMRLDPHEVVLQEFFAIDGDWSVPALFGSRVFAVWAKATISRSSSWMSRFSIGETFSAFPVPSVFKLSAGEKSTVITSADRTMLEQSREIHARLDREIRLRTSRTLWKSVLRSEEWQREPLRRRLEETILTAYDLPDSADDLMILKRLIQMNKDSAA